MELATYQQTVILPNAAKMIVTAPRLSGKTTTVIERIRRGIGGTLVLEPTVYAEEIISKRLGDLQGAKVIGSRMGFTRFEIAGLNAITVITYEEFLRQKKIFKGKSFGDIILDEPGAEPLDELVGKSYNLAVHLMRPNGRMLVIGTPPYDRKSAFEDIWDFADAAGFTRLHVRLNEIEFLEEKDLELRAQLFSSHDLPEEVIRAELLGEFPHTYIRAS